MSHRLEIVLSNQPPVAIIEDEWPTVGFANTDDAILRVRQHASGKVLVYGVNGADPAKPVRRGMLLDAGTSPREVGRIIFGVATELGCRFMAHECLSRMPAEDI